MPQNNAKPLELTGSMQFELEASSPGADGKPALPRFRMVAYTGVPMRVAGWRHPVVVDLAGLAIPSQSRPIRFGHDAGSGVGHTDSIRVEGGQLVASGIVSRDTAAAKEVVASSKNGFPWQASIGAGVEEFEFVKENQSVMVNGRSYTGPVNVVRKATLGEISFVDLGADAQTSASVQAKREKQEMDGIDNGGVAVTTDTTTASATTAPLDTAAAAIRANALAETSRIAAIRRICDGKYDGIEALAIRDGWDATRCELEVLRASRPKAPSVPAIHVPDNSLSGTILEAACMLTARLGDVEKCYDEQTLEQASRRFRGGIGLQELLLEAAWANGYTGRNFRDSRSVLRFAFARQGFAFARDIEAGFSTIDIGGILSSVTNKFLLEGFFSVERTWRNICAVRNVSDFKTVTSYRLIGADTYEMVQPGGELKHGTLGNESYSNKADTFGLMLSIDRRDIINDDLGAITTVPRKLGRGSGLKINDVFWTKFLDNAAFFTAGNKNYIAGADTALSIDGLTKCETTFMDQVDSDGKPIGVMPQILLVPTALSAIGTQLFKSLEIRDTTANTKFPVANPHQGKFRSEVSRYLSNTKYTGNSAKAWYLLADPADLPVIEVAFLNGQESPTIETAEADFNVLGIQMRGYHDFGVALQDLRGGVKSKGEA
ncbi:hypothetical protein [Fontivita pretiosa]|uniref:phage major capsid protein n=1 Tax=Fontivita pretiosa TaxID=2989684 RepID=UPI003D177961